MIQSQCLIFSKWGDAFKAFPVLTIFKVPQKKQTANKEIIIVRNILDKQIRIMQKKQIAFAVC